MVLHASVRKYWVRDPVSIRQITKTFHQPILAEWKSAKLLRQKSPPGPTGPRRASGHWGRGWEWRTHTLVVRHSKESCLWKHKKKNFKKNFFSNFHLGSNPQAYCACEPQVEECNPVEMFKSGTGLFVDGTCPIKMSKLEGKDKSLNKG